MAMPCLVTATKSQVSRKLLCCGQVRKFAPSIGVSIPGWTRGRWPPVSVNVPAREERSWCRLMEGFIRNFIICGIFSVMCGIFFPNACGTNHVCLQFTQNIVAAHLQIFMCACSMTRTRVRDTERENEGERERRTCIYACMNERLNE